LALSNAKDFADTKSSQPWRSPIMTVFHRVRRT
jgi:hypothetical protein